jgi:hypothetical protein
VAHVLTADPWDSDPFDVESINAEASDHILAEIAAIAAASDAGKQPRTSATLVLGPAGAGKTHLFTRLRARLGLAACFVHVRPLFGIAPSQRLVLAAILDALAHRTAPNGLTQIDLFAGSVLARAMDLGKRPNMAIETLRGDADRERGLARVAEQVERSVRGLHGPTLRHVLRLLFSDGVERQARLRYLEGEELTEEEASALGMRADFPQRLSDVDTARAVTTIARLASLGTPLVIAFDQLENLDTGDASRAVVFGHLVRELHDTAPGLVMVLLALDDLWRRRIAPALPEAARAAIGRHPRTLRNPTAEEKDALLDGWRAREPELAAHPFPFPFTTEVWSAWRSETSATPRVLLEELDRCHEERRAEAREAHPGGWPSAASAPSPDGTERGRGAASAIEEDLSRRIGAAHDEVRRNGTAHPVGIARLAASLAQVLRLAGDEASTGEHGDELVVEGTSGRRRLLVAQHTNHTSLAAALKRALADGAALALREARVPLRASWKVCRELQAALSEDARWLELDADDVAWAIGVHDLMAAARSGEVVDDRGRTVDAATVAARCEALVAASPVAGRLHAPAAASKRAATTGAAAPSAAHRPAATTRAAPSKPTDAAPAATKASGAAAPRKARGAPSPPKVTPSKGAPASWTREVAPTTRATGSSTTTRSTASGEVLARLGVASVDRVLRELRREVPEATRAMVLEELGGDDAVTFLGPSIVAKKALRR